jgi:hypothetical protein
MTWNCKSKPPSDRQNTELIFVRPDGMMFHHRAAPIEPPAQTVIDPRLLSAHYSITIKEPVKCEPPPRRRPEARKASLTTLDDPDFEVDDSSGLDDDEYTPFEETNRKKRVVLPTKKRRTMSPSPNVTVPNPKHRARNFPSSTDEVERELKRISNIKTAKKKTPGRRNKDFSCQICYKQCNRQSDLVRHVLTHYPLRDTNTIVCRGISREEALEHNIDSRHLRTCHEQDGLRIGGCGMSFSRRDALLRHVKLRTSQCIFLSEYSKDTL